MIAPAHFATNVVVPCVVPCVIMHSGAPTGGVLSRGRASGDVLSGRAMADGILPAESAAGDVLSGEILPTAAATSGILSGGLVWGRRHVGQKHSWSPGLTLSRRPLSLKVPALTA